MKLPHRRQFLHLAAGAAALPAVSRTALAEGYPTKPVHLIVPFPAGGAIDITARLIGQWLSERLGEQFIIEARPGAGGNIGTEAAVNAPHDGYTLLMVDASVAINATLYDKLNFNFLRDTVTGVANSIEYIKTGKLRALAVTTATRLEALPDIPTVSEFVPGYEASTWYGVGAPVRRPLPCLRLGAISLSSSGHFPPNVGSLEVNPVIMPPGRARLATKPLPTGSETLTKTIGIAIRRIGVLFDPDTAPYAEAFLHQAQASARTLAIELFAARIYGRTEIERTMAALAGDLDSGLIVLPEATTNSASQLIIEFGSPPPDTRHLRMGI